MEEYRCFNIFGAITASRYSISAIAMAMPKIYRQRYSEQVVKHQPQSPLVEIPESETVILMFVVKLVDKRKGFLALTHLGNAVSQQQSDLIRNPEIKVVINQIMDQYWEQEDRAGKLSIITLPEDISQN